MRNEAMWERWQRKNTDGYGQACIKAAKHVMAQLENHEGEIKAADMIAEANRELELGLSGAQAGVVAMMVSHCADRGEVFRKAWNSNYGVEGEGTVNPAVVEVAVRI